MEKRVIKYSFFLFASFLILFSCNRDVTFSDVRIMDNSTWNLMDVASFSVPVDDTISSGNVSFQVSADEQKPWTINTGSSKMMPKATKRRRAREK